MDYTFFVTYNSVVTQVFPLNWLECSLVDEKEKDQVFYRRKFDGTLTFGGKRLCADYDLFNDIRLIDPCGRIDFLILLDLDIYWEGYFSTSMGEWDLDNQIFTITPTVTDDYSDWDLYGNDDFNLLTVPATIDPIECNGYSYTRMRWLIDVIEYLAQQVFGPATTITSRFFTESTNYVTLLANQLLYLTIAQKSDIKYPTSSDPATIANMTFNELMDILRGRFNCYWKYDGITVTVEHISLFTSIAGIDLRTQEIAERANRYKYLREKMPKHEWWYSMEAKSPDFIFGHAWYDDNCVNQDSDTNVIEYRDEVTVEIEYIQTSVLAGDTGDISNDGFVILANYLTAGDYHTYSGAGLSDMTIRFNMPLAWSYLTEYYHKHNRVLIEGYFYVFPKTFVSAQKRKIQEINAIICNPQNTENYDPNEYITTELGETHFGGEKGYVEKAIIKPYGEINFTLAYGPVDNENEGASAPIKTLRVYQNDLEITSYLSEPNIYDTYYSIWTNEAEDPDDVCDLIMIPAGVMYQEDLLTQVNPINTVSYNFTDPSLAGWQIEVNDSTSYDTHTDGECDTGTPAPPAVPDIPDIIGHNQYETCGPVRINWTAEADATYYVLQRKPSMGGNPVWETQYSGPAIFYDDGDAGWNEGTTYLYRAAAGNISGLSGWSAEHVVDDIMC